MYSYFNIADNQYLTYELTQEAASKIPAETHFVTLRLGTDGAQAWKAKLDYLSPNVTLTTGTLRLRAELDNSDGSFVPDYLSVSRYHTVKCGMQCWLMMLLSEQISWASICM